MILEYHQNRVDVMLCCPLNTIYGCIMTQPTKICSKCNLEIPVDQFYRDKSKKDGRSTICKLCRQKYDQSPKGKTRQTKYETSTKGKNRQKGWREKNPETIKKLGKEWREKNKEKDYLRKKIWNEENREKINDQQRLKRETDPNYQLYYKMSNSINKSLRGNKNGYKWESLVDFTFQQLKDHLEKQFEDWMTWNNHTSISKSNGKKVWHIDHIIPSSSFSFTSPDDPEFKQCWCLKNLRPLEALENISKGAKILT